MKSLALLIGVGVLVVGIVGFFAPERLIGFGQQIMTPGGLYAIAALRIGIGLVLIGASPGSRAPGVLRIVAVIVIVGGLMTPWFGTERSRLVLDWLVSQGPAVLRVGAVFILTIGGGLIYLVGGRRPVA